MNKEYISDKDRFDFVSMMTNFLKSKDYSRRIALCMKKISVKENQVTHQEVSSQDRVGFATIRKKHHPNVTADLLSLFGSPSNLKYMTHDFDPALEISMNDVISRSLETINSPVFRYNVPGSLYLLLDRFINGPDWTDYKGEKHLFHLLSDRVTEWVKTFPTLHPLISDELGSEINAFRNTVRVAKPNLSSIFNSLLLHDSRLKELHICTYNLDKADFYTNVFWISSMIFRKVLIDVAQRQKNAEVKISYFRSAWQQYRLCSIQITHIGSEANPFNDVKQKLMSEGGELYNIMKSCKGYCDWTVEANFEGEYKRWRILNFRDLPEEEDIPIADYEGFSHIFTFYKKQ